MSGYIALASRLRAAVAELETAVRRINTLRQKAMQDADFWDGVALNLHGFYTGVEQMLEDIARTIDQSVPDGPQWHRDLVLQLSAGLAATRPVFLGLDTARCLDDFRSFRHVVRNVYTFSLRPARVRELAETVPDCYALVVRDVARFAAFLESAGVDADA